MAEASIASEVAVAEIFDEQPPEANSLKRKQSEEAEEEEQGSKRQRVGSGKTSTEDTAPAPTAPAEDVEQNKESVEDDQPKVDTQDPPRRKSSIADEKQRSKRLFGALLGSLNQPGDRTSKRRQEIESRRKAELQRQDDEHVEDRLRRQEKLAERRRSEQERVDEENMHIRHKNLLHTANFLQTTTEPRLYYRPWELRPDEEDQIEAQIKDAQAQIDQELDEFEQRRPRDGNGIHQPNLTHSRSQTRTMSPGREHAAHQPPPGPTRTVEGTAEEEDPASAKSEDSKPAEVPDSDPTNADDTNNSRVLETSKTEVPDADVVKNNTVEEDDDEGDDGGNADEEALVY